MIIKNSVHKEITETKIVKVEESIWGCDQCGSEIYEYPNLEIKVFHQDDIDNVDTLHFCSWECLFKNVLKIKTDHFISLPFVTFDSKRIADNKTNAVGFKKLIRKCIK